VILTSESRDGIVIIKFSGKLVFDESLYKLRPMLRELLDSGTKAIIFELAEVSHCDSSGLGEMIGAYTTIRKHDAAVAFASLTPKVRVLWERINITRVFDIFDTVAEAENFFLTGRSR
jgi:anti-sigma B factor antagonist